MRFSDNWSMKAATLIGLAMCTGSADLLAQQLEEVVVTAQRRTQSVQDIPVAVTSMSGEELDELGFESLNDIWSQVPNMQVSNPYGAVQPIFSIRGVSMSDYNSNQASPIGVYVDDAYIGAVFTHGLNFFDVERIEVLRGPQGTLYGKNTTGGAINVISRTPPLEGPLSGDLRLGYGNHEAVKASGGIEGALVPGVLSARFAFDYRKDDGYYKNALGGPNLAQTDFRGARVTLNWQPTDRLNALFKYTASKTTPRSHPPRNEGRIPIPGLGNVDIAGYQRPASLDFQEGELDKAGKTDIELDLATLKLSYDMDRYSIVSVSSWYDADYFQGVDTDGSPLTTLEIDWGSKTNAFSQDIRFVSHFEGRVNFIAGLYYDHEDLKMRNLLTLYEDPTILLGTPLGNLLTEFGMVDQRLDTEKRSLAAYTQFRVDFTERLGLDIGLRYTDDKNSLDYVNLSRLDYDGSPLGSWVPGNITGTAVDNAFLPPEFDPAGEGFYIDGPYTLDSAPTYHVSENEWTGKVSLDYAFKETMMGYASYSHGYRTGSFNGGLYYVPRPLDGAYARPEFVDTYEIGLKSDLLDGKLRVNAAAFYYDYKDQQFINVVGVSTFLENAGQSEIWGFEMELWAQPVENLFLQASLGWLDTEYTELELANTVTSDPGDQIDLSGNELISAPRINLSFAGDYDIDLSDWGFLRLHLDASYQDDQWYSAYNEKIGYGQIKQDAFWLVNGRLSVFFGAARNFSLSAWIKNLADEKYDAYAINVQAGFGYDYFLSGPPRTYGLEFNYQF